MSASVFLPEGCRPGPAPGECGFGDVGREAALALGGTVVAPLGHLALIRATGADVDAFLQGQLSNDVRQLTRERAQLSSFNSPRGRLLAVLHLLRTPDDVLLELPRALLEPVRKRLAMYVLRSKVQLAEADDRVEIGVAGPEAPLAIAALDLPAPTAALECAWAGDLGIVRRLGATPRYAVIAPAARAPALWQRLREHATPVGTQAWKLLDIEAGVPAVYPETQDRFVAQMCNLDGLGGISFDKGCYTGQEVVARVHYRGAVKRHMSKVSLKGPPPAPGTKIDEGEVVDSAPSPESGAIALVVAST